MRSKTIKPRLKSCPAHEVCDAGTTCYVKLYFAKNVSSARLSLSGRAPTQVSEARKTKKEKILQQNTNRNHKENNITAFKTCLRETNYRRNQKYSRTLNSVAHCFRARKTKASPFQDYSFCFFVLSEAFKLLFLYPHNAELSGSF